MRREADIDAAEVGAIYAEMETGIRALLQSEGADAEDIVIIREIEACYVGQSFRLKLPLRPSTPRSCRTWSRTFTRSTATLTALPMQPNAHSS